MKKIAIINGITGQDGAYLAELLLKKKYQVIGLYNKKKSNSFSKLNALKIKKKIELISLNQNRLSTIKNILKKNVSEFYNLAAISTINQTLKYPIKTIDVNGFFVGKLLEVIYQNNPNIRFFQSLSVEMIERNLSPYSIAKIIAFYSCLLYRKYLNLYISIAYLSNHSSPLQSDEFVIKKIFNGLSKKKRITLGDIYVKRDIGFAKEFVYHIWKSLQKNKSQEIIITSKKKYTIKEIINHFLQELKIEASWANKGFKEKLICSKTKKILIDIKKKILEIWIIVITNYILNQKMLKEFILR